MSTMETAFTSTPITSRLFSCLYSPTVGGDSGQLISPRLRFQRIPGSSLSPSLQYFGRSMSTRLDLDGDELIDLAVGAHGSAVLLR